MTEPEHEHDDETVEDTPVTPEELAEEEEAEEEQPEPEPEPQAPQDDKEIEKAAKALVRLATSNANRISQIMGEDAQNLEPCPRCMGGDPAMPKTPGFIWPANLVPLLPEHKAAVKLSIGEGAAPEYRTNDDAMQCQKCGGEGEYETGSKVRSQRTIRCDLCDGRGWIGQRSLNAPAATPNGPVEPLLVTVGSAEPPADADPWGRLRGDPNYGVLPGFEG